MFLLVVLIIVLVIIVVSIIEVSVFGYCFGNGDDFFVGVYGEDWRVGAWFVFFYFDFKKFVRRCRYFSIFGWEFKRIVIGFIYS